MIEMGIIVGTGLLVTLVKMNWIWRMRMLSSPLVVDALIFIVLMVLHWGSYSGVMVASVGALTCSLTLSAARSLYGHVEAGVYQRGYFDIGAKLTEPV